jgi:hypothetical protein
MQGDNNGKITFLVKEHSHGDHTHVNTVHATDQYASGLKNSDEGCPCCAIGVDLDEVAAAASEMGKEGSKNSTGQHSPDHGGLGGSLADFSSGAHWGMFAFSGAFAILGLTASVRNIIGTWNTYQKLDKESKQQKKKLEELQLNQGENQKMTNLQAYINSLKYSMSDTAFNFWVPGVVNGIASSMVLSSAIWTSPWALPFISFYAGCQTVKNLYDLGRNWNEIIACQDGASAATKAGIAKINEITKAKRLFYSANAAGFLVFTAGGISLFLSTSGITPSNELMIAGIILLVIGSLSTAVMNNIWTTKFKPRNGNLGVDRLELDPNKAYEEIGKRQEERKVLTEYRKKLIAKSSTDGLKKFGYKLLTSLPFCEQKGTQLIHQLNTSNYQSAINKEKDNINEKRLKMLNKLYKSQNIDLAKDITWSKDSKERLKKVFEILKELKLETHVLDKFIKKYVLKSTNEHDTTTKKLEAYLNKLREAEYFKLTKDNECHKEHSHEEHSHEEHKEDEHLEKDNSYLETEADEPTEIELDINSLNNAQTDKLFNNFMESVEEYLIFDRVESLKYQIYGLNDYYWEIDKVKEPPSRITQTKPSSGHHPHGHSRHGKHGDKNGRKHSGTKCKGRCPDHSF